MRATEAPGRGSFVIDAAQLDPLLHAVRDAGYTLIGPTVRDGAIVYDEIVSAADLPAGLGEEQSNGTYRLKPRGDTALFGFNAGPHSWKRFLHPPAQRLFVTRRAGNRFHVEEDEGEAPRYAFLGVRPCDAAALSLLDRVLLGGAYADPAYRARREKVLILAVQCVEAGGTCFCASLGTGPRAATGFDLAFTERLPSAGAPHTFLVEVGSDRGEALLSRVPRRPASREDVAEAVRLGREAASRMGRTLETAGLEKLLEDSFESPRWEDISHRCASCANCTMVCPTCFCTTVEDASDLSGSTAERWRRWDSCHTLDFSYIHGGSIRKSAASRYRQWMTHKLSSWSKQFGTSGCVGCGRCITWCPTGIDITEEARLLRQAGPAG